MLNQDTIIVIEGRRAPEEAAVSAGSLRYLPFDVPEGVTGITVAKDFDHGPDPSQKNMVDLGLFDPRGYGWGGPGFRGWPGGAAGDVTLTGDFATTSPSCLPGPLVAGRWHLAQWFLRSTPFGLGYRYTVTLSFDGPRPPRRMPPVPTYAPGVLNAQPGWYIGSLHTHTLHSDGSQTAAELTALHKKAGYHFLAVTDHNATRAHYHFKEAAQAHPDLLLLYGNELTSPFGHAGVLGQRPGHWFDFRLDGGDGRLPQIIEEAHRQGALFVVNHPFTECTTCSWRYPEQEWREADAVEVWNGRWGVDDQQAVQLWDALLKSGRRMTALGGSDFHHEGDPLLPAVRVWAQNLSAPAVQEALRAGRAFVCESPQGPELYLSAQGEPVLPGETVRCAGEEPVVVTVRVIGGRGMTLRLVWQNGETCLPVPSEDALLQRAVSVEGAHGSYVRAELVKPNGSMAALTNPIYLRCGP